MTLTVGDGVGILGGRGAVRGFRVKGGKRPGGGQVNAVVGVVVKGQVEFKAREGVG